MATSDPRKVREFCKVVAQACHDGILTWQQGKTLMGQAKHGELTAAKRGLQTVLER